MILIARDAALFLQDFHRTGAVLFVISTCPDRRLASEALII
ncbi:hypothetical protein Y88_2123 [Novosphingobium nitrogenifigens DSM 19370]|uniref:Uncharacterized protein n=1 Tax=Novosphingobium nitrogenifigens DSM 19370 TaxID=983920 RepID=F1Z571_9SPHN|nr:hypothetical protein Y88_2123 [Novosphingobium nitrogenifigens DSM 19370]